MYKLSIGLLTFLLWVFLAVGLIINLLTGVLPLRATTSTLKDTGCWSRYKKLVICVFDEGSRSFYLVNYKSDIIRSNSDIL